MSQANVEDVRICLDSGEDVRHSDEIHELLIFIGDRQYSVNVINVGIQEFMLATPVVAFWSEDPVYAGYLLSSFESAWSHAVPAAKSM